MTAASLLLICDAPFGPGNEENLRLATRALDQGVPGILLEQVPIEERDFTEGRASTLWGGLRERCRIAHNVEEVLDLADRTARTRG
jgi:hypothetical protein